MTEDQQKLLREYNRIKKQEQRKRDLLNDREEIRIRVSSEEKSIITRYGIPAILDIFKKAIQKIAN